VRLATLEQVNKAAAQPVTGDTVADAAASRGGVISVRDTLPPGIEFARYAMCLAAAKGSTPQALEIARARYPDQGRIATVLKAAVNAGTTTDPTWAGSLVEYQQFSGDFIEFLRPATIIGKFGLAGIPSLRRVPFNVRLVGQTSGGTGYWVGQGAPKPLTKPCGSGRQSVSSSSGRSSATNSGTLFRVTSHNSSASIGQYPCARRLRRQTGRRLADDKYLTLHSRALLVVGRERFKAHAVGVAEMASPAATMSAT